MKLGLGTAQFGLDYGITNTRGRTPEAQVAAMLDAAELAGVTLIDTAPSYGVAEEVLGMAGVAGRFRVVTKTPVFGGGPGGEAADELERSLLLSLERLRVSTVYGLLVHHACDALTEDGGRLVQRARDLRQQGLVTRIGVSVYSSEEALEAVDRLGVDIVQLPISVYDQRALRDGTLAALHAADVEVHARSVFLQGIMLTSPAALPARFERIRAWHEAYYARIAELGYTPVRAALGFVTGLPQVDVVVCGVEDLAQLADLVASVAPIAAGDLESFAIDDPTIVDPSRWER